MYLAHNSKYFQEKNAKFFANNFFMRIKNPMHTSFHAPKVVSHRSLKLDNNGIECLRALEEEVLKTPPVDCLMLDLYAATHPDPDLALSIFHILARRDPQTLLLARAMTSLGPCEALIFLAADERDCLPSIGLAIPPDPAKAKLREGDSFHQDDSGIALKEWDKPATAPSTCRGLIAHRQQDRLLSELSQYIELQATEQFITADEFPALGLVGNGFRELFAQVEKRKDSPEAFEPLAEDGPTNLFRF